MLIATLLSCLSLLTPTLEVVGPSGAPKIGRAHV